MRTRTNVLVGRENELALGTDAISAVRDGRAAILLVEGEAGIGKTQFTQALIDRARDTGMTVLRGEAHPLEATKPFGAVASALGVRRTSSDPRRAAIGGLLAGDTPHGPGGVSGSTDVRYRVVEDIVDLLEGECSRCPVIMVLEDLHCADDSTLLTIRTLARDLVHVPLLLVATFRPIPRSPELEQVIDDVIATGAQHISLGPLSPKEIDALVRAEEGAPAGPALTTMIEAAGGNPLWVVEILRSLSAEGQLEHATGTVEATTSALPDSLRELVVRRLRYLPQDTLDLLRMAAVLGDRLSVDDLATVTHRRAAELLPALAAVFRAQLLGEDGDAIVFRHQLVHDAIYHAIPAPARRSLHREVAGALAPAGADMSQVASHLLRGASRGDAEAIRWLRDAARDASARAPSVTVELLQCAQRLLPEGSPDADLVEVDLIEALLLSGHVADATRAADAILARPHRSEVEVPVRLLLLETLSLQNRGQELIDRASAALETPLSDSERALVLAQAS